MFQDFPDRQVFPEKTDSLESKANAEKRATLVRPALTEPQDMLVNVEPPERLEHQDTQEAKACQESPAHRAPRVSRVTTDFLDSTENRVWTENRDLKVSWDPPGCKNRRRLARQESTDTQERRDTLERTAPQVWFYLYAWFISSTYNLRWCAYIVECLFKFYI